MISLEGNKVKLKDDALLTKERDNYTYLTELNKDALLMNYYNEAGLNQNYGKKIALHTGWEDPTCQLRGHFLGHYLSAVALTYHETGDEELLAKGNAIVHELKKCQIENGGEWVASIPEKYFYWIAKGKQVWAPHYTVHKTFLGLNDMYRYTGNKEALEVSINFSKWFFNWVKDKSYDEMDDILDFETGGMLEIWADLYEFTKDEMYLTLIDKYDRRRLFNPLLEGVDVLTNMHANTTIPEAIGCARIYEATGIERFKNIAMAYFDLAVFKRGTSVTGGQTCGEIWTPPHSMENRLGQKNQEHCTVYNMIRLADILFKWTKDHRYLDYIEKNLYNGIMSQGHFRTSHANGEEALTKEEGLITYFQPLRSGAKKVWASKFSDFFCCHGTLVQANASHNRYLYYQEDKDIYTGVYAASLAAFDIDGATISINQYRDTLSGCYQSSSTNDAKQSQNDISHIYMHHPDVLLECFEINMDSPLEFTLNLRLPAWVHKKATLMLNEEEIDIDSILEGGFIRLKRTFKAKDIVKLMLPMDIYTTQLEDDSDMVAFSYGPYVLAGLCREERTLYTHGHELSELLIHDNEREWGSWIDTFRTKYQDPGINFIPLNKVGYENYQVYFPVCK
ncbi:MAG: glycoside hydrolase family 127 protein [Lachnospiraceae bacterium]|nr:glycoside hydrolase family 127 protein [Lachnospiraceae bacterium]